MGVSTDAILFWGIAYEDGAELPEGAGDTIYKALREDQDRDIPRPDPDQDRFAWDEWRSKVWEWKKGQCELDNHCSGDYPIPYVAVEASKTTARRGTPQEIASLAVAPDWEAKLRAFCERFGLPRAEPKWWLVSYWG